MINPRDAWTANVDASEPGVRWLRAVAANLGFVAGAALTVAWTISAYRGGHMPLIAANSPGVIGPFFALAAGLGTRLAVGFVAAAADRFHRRAADPR